MNAKQADIISEVLKELKRAKKKHPAWPQHIAARAGIVCEEAGELMKAALEIKYHPGRNGGYPEQKRRLRKEAIQTAATAIRLLEVL